MHTDTALRHVWRSPWLRINFRAPQRGRGEACPVSYWVSQAPAGSCMGYAHSSWLVHWLQKHLPSCALSAGCRNNDSLGGKVSPTENTPCLACRRTCLQVPSRLPSRLPCSLAPPRPLPARSPWSRRLTALCTTSLWPHSPSSPLPRRRRLKSAEAVRPRPLPRRMMACRRSPYAPCHWCCARC